MSETATDPDIQNADSDTSGSSESPAPGNIDATPRSRAKPRVWDVFGLQKNRPQDTEDNDDAPQSADERYDLEAPEETSSENDMQVPDVGRRKSVHFGAQVMKGFTQALLICLMISAS